MPYTHRGRTLRKVGVIGSGQIGPDIALYFTKVLHRSAVPVVVVDVSAEALGKGEAKVRRKVEKGVESKAFKPEEAKSMLANLSFTGDYDALRDADLIVEAATESEELKSRIFQNLEHLCGPETLLISNSSHMEPETIFRPLARKARTAVVHYFFPAERNLLVEVVPGKETSEATADWLMGFYEAIGKVPIRVRSRYGYAIDPVFEGLFQAAALCVEEGLGTTKEVDAVACRALGLRVGPFTAMNLTGGNPITRHGLSMYTTKIMPWFKPPRLMVEQMEKGAPWEVPGRDEAIRPDEEREKRIAEALQGAYVGLCCEVLESGITNVADLEMGVETALDMKPPFRLMNELGAKRSLELVEAYAKGHPGFVVAKRLRDQAATGRSWVVPVVLRRDLGDVALLVIRRPKVLNALSGEAFDQIALHFDDLRKDAAVKAVVLTGFGTKAFVSGADVGFLARIDSPRMGEETSRGSQRILEKVEALGKPVVCALNGMAFGGGMELAMACTARIARKGLAVLGGQPEVNLGIIPGAGGTQRLPRLIGVEKAAELLRTGRPFSSAEAKAWGLISEEVEGDLVERAVALARDLAAGKAKAPEIPMGPLSGVPASLPALELGHLSRRIDAILCDAILNGARKPLAEGIAYEATRFGECASTEDMKIGIRNFLQNGPKAKAAFVHR